MYPCTMTARHVDLSLLVLVCFMITPQVGGVTDPASRYRIIYPENHQRLPRHMSTAAKLLASPKALKRLRAVVSGRLAYMVPGTVSDEDVDLAVALGTPLLGPLPYTCR